MGGHLLRLGAVAALVVVATTGCNGGGSVTPPTAVSRTSPTSAAAPSLTLPTVTRSSETPAETPTETPTQTPTETPTETPSGTASERPTVTRPTQTATVTQTDTATVTQTNTATVTQTSTATVTRTSTATVTPSPTTATPSPTQSTTPPSGEVAAAPVADQGTVWWPWLLLAVVVLGLLTWLLLRRRSANQALAAWDARLDAAEQEASWVEDALTAQVLATPTTDEAQAIWTAAQPRLLAMDESLHALVTDAPDEQRAAAATNLREQLGRLVEAVGTEVAGGADTTADDFRTRRAAVDAARRDLRQTLGPVGPSQPPGPAGR